MVFKSALAKDIGSVTSSNAFLGNIIAGALTGSSGYLVEGCAGDYRVAFALGICLSTVGLVLLVIYRHLLIKGGPIVRESGMDSGEALPP